MDTCRTALRLGAKEVYNIYRRTKAEMPAEAIEISEAEEEGVIFKNLTNPIEVIKGDDGQIVKSDFKKMALGEPDAGGRRSRFRLRAEEEILDIDTLILAIGQGINPDGIGGKKWSGADQMEHRAGRRTDLRLTSTACLPAATHQQRRLHRH